MFVNGCIFLLIVMIMLKTDRRFTTKLQGIVFTRDTQ